MKVSKSHILFHSRARNWLQIPFFWLTQSWSASCDFSKASRWNWFMFCSCMIDNECMHVCLFLRLQRCIFYSLPGPTGALVHTLHVKGPQSPFLPSPLSNQSSIQAEVSERLPSFGQGCNVKNEGKKPKVEPLTAAAVKTGIKYIQGGTASMHVGKWLRNT